jgi:hypothetical protein
MYTGHNAITLAVKYLKVWAPLALPNLCAASGAHTTGLLCLVAGVKVRYFELRGGSRE